MNTYKGYTIRRVTYQGCANYQVTTPNGTTWPEIASSRQTARKWVDVHLAEHNAKLRHYATTGRSVGWPDYQRRNLQPDVINGGAQ